MRLLFDESLSPKLPSTLASLYPGSTHVTAEALGGRSDREIWDHARSNGFVIVTKDDDFRQLAFLHGSPPKIVWLSVGNAGTGAIAELLVAQRSRLLAFGREPETSLLVMSAEENS